MTSHIRTLLGSVGSCLLLCAVPAHAQTAASALSGQVSSSAEGSMEGVLVSAKEDNSPITTTVVSDDKGHFSFPADRLSPGHYTLSIRAVGYDLQGPKAADVSAGKAATADLTLTKTKNLEAQLSNAEWMNSFPVADGQKSFMTDCTGCHTLARPADSKFTAEQWPDIVKLMASFSAESTPDHPQPLVPGPRNRAPNAKVLAAAAKVLSQVNLSQGATRSYPLQTMPRPKGRATHVIITQYDLPTKAWWPHDVILDAKGNVWFDDFGANFVGEMDPKTGKVTSIALPTLKNDGSPMGNLDLEWGPKGNLWVAMMYQGGLAEVDPNTKAVKTFKLPDSMQNASTQESFVSPQHSDVDGNVWTNNQDEHSLLKLDVSTGKFERGSAEKDADGNVVAAYQMPTDNKNNVYLLNFGGTRVGYVDKTTGVATAFNTPTAHSRPRRGVVDPQNRLWFAEFGGNAIGMFDPATKKITEWTVPTKWSAPYDVDYSAKYNEAWSGSMLTDKVDRLDVKSGQFTEYLLPRSTNIRRVFIDQRGVRPALWVGSTHDASIIKVEPLD